MNDTPLPGKPGTNRHPVDQLATVRATIKALEARESELKEQISAMMGAADSLGGDEFIARQKLQTRKGALDEKKLEAKLGDLAAYRKKDSTYIVLNVEARVMEAA